MQQQRHLQASMLAIKRKCIGMLLVLLNNYGSWLVLRGLFNKLVIVLIFVAYLGIVLFCFTLVFVFCCCCFFVGFLVFLSFSITEHWNASRSKKKGTRSL